MKYFAAAALAFSLAACAPQDSLSPPSEANFLAQFQPLCGKAYGGKIISSDAADDEWRKEEIIMHVRDCSGGEVKIALHVGDNRSRTWILRREGEDVNGNGGLLALRHDHRHEDGKPDALTFYGGLMADVDVQKSTVNDRVTKGNYRMAFPADQSTKDLFDREDIPVSKDNTWTINLSPNAKTFTYEMSRPNRDFRIEFDTSKTVDTPPTPWGW